MIADGGERKSGLLRKECRVTTGHKLAAADFCIAQGVTDSATENVPPAARRVRVKRQCKRLPVRSVTTGA